MLQGFKYFFTATLILVALSLPAQNYYFGNIHAHSIYSDGNQANTPGFSNVKSCFNYAKASLHADYLGISDHNHSMAGMNLADYRSGVREKDSVNQNGVFVTMYGMEYGVISNGGHVLIYGFDSLIGWEPGNYDIYNSQYNYNTLFTRIARTPGTFAYLAHMATTDYDSILYRPYNATYDSAIVGLAMRSGPAFSTDTTYNNPSSGTYLARYQDLLKKGYHVGVGIDHDNHYITFERSCDGRTVILANSLTRADIMNAYLNMHFYASDDWNAHVDFRVNNYITGSIVNGTSDPSITLSVTDADPENVSSIKIWYGVAGSGVASTVLTSNTNLNSINFTHAIGGLTHYYYYAEITQADGDKIWTSPVWYTKSPSPLSVQLISFDAQVTGDAVTARWATATENSSDYFILQRSKNAEEYEEVCRIPAKGNSNVVSTYETNDLQPLKGLSYYRLLQVDKNGHTAVYAPVTVKVKNDEHSLFIYPNPTNDVLWIEPGIKSEQPVLISLFSEQGREVYRINAIFNADVPYMKMDVSLLPPGIYLVKVLTNDGKVFSQKVVIN